MFSSILKKAISLACYGFCVLTLLYSFIMLCVHDSEASMSVLVVFLFFPFCFSMTFVDGLLRASKLGGGVRTLLLYVTFLVSFVLLICLPHKAALSGASLLVLLVAASLIYGIGFLLYTWVILPKKQSQKSDYVSVYKTSNKK